MRVLHLFSNYKWTGPAEPALALVRGLDGAGVEVVLRSSAYTKGNRLNHVAAAARERGIEPVLDLALGKHRSPWRDAGDRRRLRAILEREGFDLIHTHLPNDHRIAARSARALGIPLVRTLYATEPRLLPPAQVRWLARWSRVLLVFSRALREHLVRAGCPPAQVHHIEPTVDLERFRPGGGDAAMRCELGFGEDDFLAGIVARVQPQRRFDLLLDAAELAARRCPRLRVLIIGRGSKLEAVARAPARRRGLLDRCVFFPGYFRGERYPALLQALDVKLFLVPGTDGTARAVREAMACGLPVLTTARGMLPELVRDGESGRVLVEDAAEFAQALCSLCEDEEGRRAMGAQAREEACRRFALDAQVEAVRAVYDGLLEVRSSP